MMVLVDTSIWSLALRRTRSQLSPTQTQQLINSKKSWPKRGVRLLGPSQQELLSGIKFPDQLPACNGSCVPLPDIALEIEDYEGAAEMSKACRTHGIIGSPIDFLLCSVALRRSWAIYTSDRDFERYGEQLPLALYH